jgi:hypothetical protein
VGKLRKRLALGKQLVKTALSQLGPNFLHAVAIWNIAVTILQLRRIGPSRQDGGKANVRALLLPPADSPNHAYGISLAP